MRAPFDGHHHALQVGEPVQRVARQHHNIGKFSRLDTAHLVLLARSACADEGSRVDHCCDWHARLAQQLVQFMEKIRPVIRPRRNVVRAGRHRHAGTPGLAGNRAAETSDAFPVGTYQQQQTIVVFNPDGSFLGTTPTRKDWVKGTYTHKGNEFTVVDTWEGDALKGEDCMGKIGRYTWTKSGRKLTAHAVEYACKGRQRGTDGIVWTQIKPLRM